MKNNRPLYHFTKLLIEFLFFSGIAVTAMVPVLIRTVVPNYLDMRGFILQTAVVLMLSGVTALYILWQIRRIFKSLVTTNPFNMENVNTLRKIAAASFIISATYLAKCLFWFTLATALIIIIFAIAGLFCLVLGDVFRQAVLYKDENDLTI